MLGAMHIPATDLESRRLQQWQQQHRRRLPAEEQQQVHLQTSLCVVSYQNTGIELSFFSTTGTI